MKASKYKGGWTSGWKKMTKPFYSKDHPDLRLNPSLVLSEKHLKAAADASSLHPQMSILHPTDVPFLQNSKAQVQGAKVPDEAPKAVAAASTVESPLKVEAPNVADKVVPQAQPALEASPLTVNELAEQALKDYQPPKPSFSKDYQPPRPSLSTDQPSRSSVSKNQSARRSVSETPEAERENSSQRHHKHPDHRGHHGRHHGKDSDTVSLSSDYSYSSAHSNPRHRSRDTSSSHHHHRDGSEDRSHRNSTSHGHGGQRSHHQSHREGSTEHGSGHHRDRSPDDRHRRSRHSPDRHPQSKDPPRPSSAGNHKHESDHHSRHHSHHSTPHHRSHHKHYHRKDYDSVSSYSSDSGSRPPKARRHAGV